jgi:hypothetical protein
MEGGRNAPLKREIEDPGCFGPRKPADDQNAISAATLVGPVFQDITETTASSQKVKKGKIHFFLGLKKLLKWDEVVVEKVLVTLSIFTVAIAEYVRSHAFQGICHFSTGSPNLELSYRTGYCRSNSSPPEKP